MMAGRLRALAVVEAVEPGQGEGVAVMLAGEHGHGIDGSRVGEGKEEVAPTNPTRLQR